MSFENEISQLKSAVVFHENAKAKLNTTLLSAKADASNFHAKLSEKTNECKIFESTSADLETLLSECQLKIAAHVVYNTFLGIFFPP